MLWTPIERERVQANLFSGSLLSALMQALEISSDIRTVQILLTSKHGNKEIQSFQLFY